MNYNFMKTRFTYDNFIKINLFQKKYFKNKYQLKAKPKYF